MAILIILGGFTIYQKDKTSSQLTIGFITGTTGQYAFVGENSLRGANLAVEEWNSLHPDDQVHLVVENDAFDAKKGFAAYQKLVNVDGVGALMNMTSVTIDVIYEDAKKLGIPIAQGGEQGIEPVDDNVFQVMPGNIATEIGLGRTVREQGYKNIAAFVTNNSTMIRFFEAFQRGYGGSVTAYKMSPDEKDLRAIVTKALEQKPDAILVMAFPEQGALAVKTLRERAKSVPQLIFDANAQSGFEDYKRVLGNENALDGSLIVVLSQKMHGDFVEKYKAKYGVEPGLFSDVAYDAFYLIMKARSNERKEWIENMKRASFEGAGGRVEFDEVGVRRPDFNVGIIQDSKLPLQ